jgi:hypothetical protein
MRRASWPRAALIAACAYFFAGVVCVLGGVE